jgi:hypothetical protein
MADVLAAITGALQGYSSGSGLDLARKLREQAALDEQALKTFQAKSEIEAEIAERTRAAGVERVAPQDLGQMTAALERLIAAGGTPDPGVVDTSEFVPGGPGTQSELMRQLSALGLESAGLEAETLRSEKETQTSLDAAARLREIVESEASIEKDEASAALSRTGAAENVAQADKIRRETLLLQPTIPKLTEEEKAQVKFNRDNIEGHVERKTSAFIQSALDRAYLEQLNATRGEGIFKLAGPELTVDDIPPGARPTEFSVGNEAAVSVLMNDPSFARQVLEVRKRAEEEARKIFGVPSPNEVDDILDDLAIKYGLE